MSDTHWIKRAELTLRNLMGAAYEARVTQSNIDAAEMALERLLYGTADLEEALDAAKEELTDTKAALRQWKKLYEETQEDAKRLHEQQLRKLCRSCAAGLSWRLEDE